MTLGVIGYRLFTGGAAGRVYDVEAPIAGQNIETHTGQRSYVWFPALDHWDSPGGAGATAPKERVVPTAGTGNGREAILNAGFAGVGRVDC